MSDLILVTGGTGTLGSYVVPRLLAAGHAVRVLTRQARESNGSIEFARGDLMLNEGIEAAVDGTSIIIHCAGNPKGDDVAARNLVAAAAREGSAHLVYISVIGADRVPQDTRLDRAMFGYFGMKRAAEQIIAESGLPWTTLRAAQFHELLFKTTAAMAKLPVMPVPSGFHFQPVDSAAVADALVAAALASPAGLVPDIAGPEILSMRSMANDYLRASGKRRLRVPMRMPGKAAKAYRAGANLSPAAATPTLTWSDFLSRQLPSSG